MRRKSLVSLVAAVALAGCAVHGPARPQVQSDDVTGAAVANIWYAPGRVILCGTSALLAAAAMTITMGAVYEGASEMMHGACSGPLTVTAEDIRNSVP